MDFPRDISQKVLKSSEIKDFFAFPLKELILISNVNHYLTLFVDDTVKLSELKIDFNKIVLLDRIVPEISGLIISNQHNGIVGMRFFDPWEGIPEDPVTGSAALVVAEYWFELFKRDYLEIEQMSDRGGKMSVKKNKNSLSITGTATIILEGKMMVGKYGK
jgi:predicted PhzF superfamily epimerase YddE/YHI9